MIAKTRWPLFDFYFGFWKLQIRTALFNQRLETGEIEYLVLQVWWARNQKLSFKLYNTWERLNEK